MSSTTISELVVAPDEGRLSTNWPVQAPVGVTDEPELLEAHDTTATMNRTTQTMLRTRVVGLTGRLATFEHVPQALLVVCEVITPVLGGMCPGESPMPTCTEPTVTLPHYEDLGLVNASSVLTCLEARLACLEGELDKPST